MDSNNFQRVGSLSNAQVGRDFESLALEYFRQQGLLLTRCYRVPVGLGSEKKDRQFDLGSDDPPVLVECKSHRWTAGGNVPSAKMTVWNEAMYYTTFIWHRPSTETFSSFCATPAQNVA